jgi:regulator of sigma E protease
MEMLFGYLHSGLSAIVPFIILLGLLIFVHEAGHFLVAKFFGVRVEVFSLGFGKKILKYKKGDTTYCLSIIPLGGYVKMFGDEINAQISDDEKKFSFTHKPVFQRIAVVLAGPLMNFFFAMLIFFIVAVIGEQMKAPVVGDIESGTPAYQMGFRSGDRILKAGGRSLTTWDQFTRLMTENHNQNLQVEVQRDGSDQVSTIAAVPKLAPNPNVLSTEDSIGDIEGLSTIARATVVGVRNGSIAANAGLQTGDVIKSVNSRPVKHFRELENLFVSLQGQPIPLEVDRYPTTESNSPQTLKIEIPSSQFASINVLGIEPSDLYLAKIVDASPAQAAGLKAGDRISQVNDIAPKRWEDVLTTVKSYNGDGSIAFTIDRAGEKMKFEITPRMTSQMNSQGGEDKRFTVGIVPWVLPAAPEMSLVKAPTIAAAFSRGVERTNEITKMTVLSFLRLVQARISPKNIGGVISIGQAASETFKMGISQFLQMMAIISINLFILNLLPVPVLDGGHLLFYVIEAIKGAPVSMRKMEIAQQIGLVVLMSLMVFALFNDFSRLLGSW